MKGNTFLTIALLAGLMLASSCNLLRTGRGQAHVTERPDNRPATDPVVDDGNSSGEEYAPHTLIISYDPEVGTAALDSAVSVLGATVIYRYKMTHAIAIRLPDSQDIHDAIRSLSATDGVLHFSRDRIYHLTDPITHTY